MQGADACVCFLSTQKYLPAVMLQQGRRTTDCPASKAVGIQGASCRSCQDGLQVVCQLLHCDNVTGHLLGNINQPALPSHQVGAEQCTPRQPAVYARTLANDREMCCLAGRAHRQRQNARAKAHSLWLQDKGPTNSHFRCP